MSLLNALILLKNATAIVGAIGDVLGSLQGLESGELTDEQKAELELKLIEVKRKQEIAEHAWAELGQGIPNPT